MALPPWLPPMADADPLTEEKIELLYVEVFTPDFKNSRPLFRGLEVWYFNNTEHVSDGKENLFWHLTHDAPKIVGEDIVPDPPRACRLPWARKIIENCDESEVLTWDYEEGSGNTHTYIWLHDHDYTIILKKYPDGRRRVLTGYFIKYPHEKRKMRRKYENRK